MPDQTRNVAPAFPYGTVRFEDGTKATPPTDWELLPPGDAGLTRRVKALGPSWTVQEKKGRKTFSHGVWAPAKNILQARQEVEEKRADPKYIRQMEQAKDRREAKQEVYVEDFKSAIIEFLNFHPIHQGFADQLADAVAAHATPVGSGTVARTERIPIEDRAAAAVIAWMRHQTTAYDSMKIERVKGRRREVRAELAQKSRIILQAYRKGESIAATCPLKKALAKILQSDDSHLKNDE